MAICVKTALGLRPKPLTLGNAQTSLALLLLNRGFHLLLVEEVVALVDDALETTAAQSLGFLAHAVVVVLLALVLILFGMVTDINLEMAESLSNVQGTCRKPIERKQENAHHISKRYHYLKECSFHLQVSERFE